jgi:DNA-binding SARP family transcriptional activator/tetratricopeptide (TPR) repeat protein
LVVNGEGAPPVDVRVLGPVDVYISGQPMKLPKLTRALVAVLAADAGRVVSMDRLVCALWGDRPPVSSRNRIHVIVSELRRSLNEAGVEREVVATSAPGYRLDAPAEILDAARFCALVAQARRSAADGSPARASGDFRSALGLWQGAAYDGACGAGLEAEAARLDELRVDVIEECIDVELACGHHAGLVAELTGLVTQHPLREQLRGQLMLCLYRCGRGADALAVYRAGHEVSTQEIGVAPGAQLQALHHSILTRHPQLDLAVPARAPAAVHGRPKPAPNQLPMAIPDFTGRTEELARLNGLLVVPAGRPATAPVVAIGGMGGVGKTTLAVRAARETASSFPDGCLFVDLHGTATHPAQPHTVLGSFLRALGVGGREVPSEAEDRLALYRTVTADRRLLIVLDDAADEAQVRPLISAGDRCSTVVTSRSALLGLDGAARLSLDVMPTQLGVAFLVAAAGLDRINDAAMAEQLVRLCGGLPLAVRIAGAKLGGQKGLTLPQLVHRLSEESSSLEELAAGDRSVRACLLLSYRRLDADAAPLFHLLGTMPGPDFTARTCAVVLDQPVSQAGRSLDRLLTAQLVTAIGHRPGEVRYRFHELVRRFASERAISSVPPAVRDDALRRLLVHYTDGASAATGLLTGGRHENPFESDLKPAQPLRFGADVEAIEWYTAEKANLLASLTEAAGRGWQTHTWQLAYALRSFFRRCSDLDDWTATHELALAAAVTLDDRTAEVRVRESLGAAYLELGRLSDAENQWSTTLALLSELGDEIGQGRSHDSLGTVYARRGEFEAAIKHHWAALDLPSYAGHPQYAAMAQLNLGAVYGELGRYHEAHDAFARALEVAERFNDAHVVCLAEHNLAEMLLRTGAPERAQAHARREIQLAQEVLFPFREARGWELLGACLTDSDDAQARSAWRRAAELYERLGHPFADRVQSRLAETR